MNVLKVSVAGQRIKYQVSKVTFTESDLQRANAMKWEDKKNYLYCDGSRLDIIRDYETFDCADIGVAITMEVVLLVLPSPRIRFLQVAFSKCYL